MKTLTSHLVLTVSALLLFMIQSNSSAVEKRETRDFTKLHAMLKPQPHESRWMEVNWYPSVWEARKVAAAEGKPIFLWAGSGGAPAAGC